MIETLLQKLDVLIVLHKRNGDIWVDFFESAREKIQKDARFGCEYLMMAWHGIGGYDNDTVIDNITDEAARRALHPQIYDMAGAVLNDKH